MFSRLKTYVEKALEAILILLVVSLTVIVVVAVVYRKFGESLVWYDEVASIVLAWVTYYGAALAALKREHIGFDGLVRAMPGNLRKTMFAISELFIFGFFVILAHTGLTVLEILEGDTLVSLPEVPVQLTQSVIPIGAVLFILCEALSLPDAWRKLTVERPKEAAT